MKLSALSNLRVVGILALAGATATSVLAAEVAKELPHLQKQGNATQLIVDGKPFLILGGQLHNSSSSSIEYMSTNWPKLTTLNLNAVLAPVTWELIEPTEGKFDFHLVDGLLEGARKNKLRLVMLWYGSWKRANLSYTPAWVKTNFIRFPRMQKVNKDKKSNLDSLSPFSDANKQADGKAFIALMHHLRQTDEKQRTVLMVQVEDEPGVLSDSRDRSTAADEAFAKPVPAELIAHLQKNQPQLNPELAKFWGDAGTKNAGTWTEVFGEGADEVFMAWNISRYVGNIAAAGKAEYGVPLYANCTAQNETARPGQYPSGEPVARMIDIWHAGAPAIDFYAPAISYTADFKTAAGNYVRADNPLFIPDATRELDCATKVFYAICNLNAMGFCPNGIDSLSVEHPLKESYATLSELTPIITQHQGKGEAIGFLQTGTNTVERVTIGNYNVGVLFNTRAKGAAMHYGIIIATGPEEFIVAGSGFQAGFANRRVGPFGTRILSTDESHYKNGTWIAGRRLNGDENSAGGRIIVRAGSPSIQRVRFYLHE